MKLTKILVILGPTASGKSSLAVELAKHFNGEIISADSRQVYKGLDVGTGKITADEMQGVPHHLLDIVDPIDSTPASTARFSVEEWKAAAEKAVAEIVARGKLPIIVGGTGFYIDALINNAELPEVDANEKLRAELSTKTEEELFKMISELDPDRAASLDPKNKRRVIRAIEIATALGNVPPVALHPRPDWDVLVIGISTPDAELKQKIRDRLIKRIEEQDMIGEAERLHAAGLSYERMDELGLEYRYLAQFLQKKITRDELIEILSAKIWQYARRQKTWFKRNEKIQWFWVNEVEKIEGVVNKFLKVD